MEKQIAAIRNKMIVVICVIAALATWQWDFVYNGVMSHLYMNLTILGTFAFGLVNGFVFLAKLKNEIIAFRALKEMSDDIRRAPEESARDPLWLYYRCAQPGLVFRRPRLLGHAYDLVTEELARTKKVRVSLETMNTLVHKVEESINDEKSLIVYLSGLLVFMGLIGTFIGLLHMVGAIGGIIGSLAKSSGGGAAAGAFGQLLGALEEPLKGMASGFASSLFGLFSSLVVGLMGRFAGQAAGVLKGAFESWLAGVVQLGDAEEGHGAPAESGSHEPVPAGVTDQALLTTVGKILKDYSRVAWRFDTAAKVLSEIRETQGAQAQTLNRALDEIARMQSLQSRMLDEISTGGATAHAVRELGASLSTFSDRLMTRVEIDGQRQLETLGAIGQAQGQGLQRIAAAQTDQAAQFARAIEMLSQDIERRTALPHFAQIEMALERGLRAGMASGLDDAQRALHGLAQSTDARLTRLSAGQDRFVQAVAEIIAEQPARESSDDVARRVEASIAEGFGRLSQTLEAALSAYASLATTAVASMERQSAENRREQKPDAAVDAA